MNQRQVFSALILLIALLSGSVASVHALPPMPATFYGNVLINGVNAPVGTVIAAHINGVEYASVTVVDAGGSSMYAIDVPGEDPEIPGIQGGVPGDIIVFSIGAPAADQTAIWQSGMLELNLSYTPNNPPTAADNNVTILEDNQKVFAPSDFNFSDSDPGDSLSQVQISALESMGALYLDSNGNGNIDSGEDVILNQVIPAANIAQLKFRPEANANSSSYTSFSFKVHDGEEYSLSAYQMLIHVTAVNDAPSFTRGLNQTVDEDPGAQSIPGWATNISSGPANESGQVLAFNITGNTNPALFSVLPAVNAPTGTLTYTPAANANGTATITIRLVDDGGTANGGVNASPTQSFTITVNPVNDLPVANPQSVTTTEDTPKSITLTGSDVETVSLAFTIVSGPSHGSLSGAAPNLTYTPTSNYFGPDSFSFKVNDGTVDSPAAQISITVTTVNDVPVCQDLSLLTTLNLSAQVATSCIDVESDTLTYSIPAQPAHGTASVVSGMLDYAPSVDYTGTDSFTYVANDGIADSNIATVSATVLAPFPTVLSIGLVDPTPTDQLIVRFAVIFSSSVTGVSLDDFAVVASGVTGAAPSAMTGSGDSYTITVNTGTGDGTLGLNLVDNNSILDQLSHPLGGPDPGDGNFTGPVYNVDKTDIYTSESMYDGWVLESTETSGVGGTLNSSLSVFNLGDDALDRQYRGIISFNTAMLPDTAVITKITLKIYKQGLVGTNPFATHGKILVDIRKGAFSGKAALQKTDFQASASKSGIGTIKNLSSGNWYQTNLLSTSFTSVDKLGITQLRLRFSKDDNDDRGADYLKFYTGNASATYRPQLIIQYYIP